MKKCDVCGNEVNQIERRAHGSAVRKDGNKLHFDISYYFSYFMDNGHMTSSAADRSQGLWMCQPCLKHAVLQLASFFPVVSTIKKRRKRDRDRVPERLIEV